MCGPSNIEATSGHHEANPDCIRCDACALRLYGRTTMEYLCMQAPPKLVPLDSFTELLTQQQGTRQAQADVEKGETEDAADRPDQPRASVPAAVVIVEEEAPLAAAATERRPWLQWPWRSSHRDYQLLQ